MKDENIELFIKALGETAYLQGDWIKCSCPLAFATHSSGKDSNPSFGISRGNKKAIGNCFSCGFSKPLEDLLTELIYQSQFIPAKKKINYKAAYELVNNEEDDLFFEKLPDYEAEDTDVVFSPFAESWLKSFASAKHIQKAKEYLYGRGLTSDEIEKYDIKWDSSKGMVCFPFRDNHGVLAGMRGRSITAPNHHDYRYKDHSNSKFCWYGEHLCDLSEPLIVCEGQFDYVKIRRHFPNTLAGLTASLPHDRLKKLEYTSHVIGFWDNDKAGKKASEICAEYLGNKGILYTPFPYTDVGAKEDDDPDDLSDEQIEKGLNSCIQTLSFTDDWEG